MAREEFKAREVTAYLRPAVAVKFNKLISDKSMGKSEALNTAVELLLQKNGYAVENRSSKNSY